MKRPVHVYLYVYVCVTALSDVAGAACGIHTGHDPRSAAAHTAPLSCGSVRRMVLAQLSTFLQSKHYANQRLRRRSSPILRTRTATP